TAIRPSHETKLSAGRQLIALGGFFSGLRKVRAQTACGVNITASRSAHFRKALHWPMRFASVAKACSASTAVATGAEARSNAAIIVPPGLAGRRAGARQPACYASA